MSKKRVLIYSTVIAMLLASLALTAGGGKSKPYTGPMVDVQAHAMMPGPGVDAAKAALAADPSVEEETKQTLSSIYDLMADNLEGDLRLEALGEDDMQIVTAQMGFPPLPAGALIGMTAAQNAWLAQRTAANPQLIGIATIAPPPTLAAQGMAEAGLQACRSAIVDMGLKGILLSAQYEGVFLGDPVYEPYFALAEELGVPIIIHPAVDASGWDLVPRRAIPVAVGFMNDQRLTLIDLVKAGVLENHPDLIIIATHLGGGVLQIAERTDELDTIFPAERWYFDLEGEKQTLPHPASFYLKQIYYDCNNASSDDITAAVKKVGVSQLMTGSDFPFFDEQTARASLGNASLSHRAKRAIAYENAAQLFGLDH